MNFPDIHTPTPVTKPYKNTQFNKKLAKARTLLNSIDATSLKPSDKKLLKSNIKELFS